MLVKTVMITGADSGLGFETALKIAADGEFDLILACRNEEKAKAAWPSGCSSHPSGSRRG